MANEEHLAILRQGVNLWNAWRKENDEIQPNLSQADLSGVKLMWADFSYANQQERRPSSGNFACGEFAQLFQKSLETVDLIFRNRIDWNAFAYSFKKLEVENQGAQLDVQSIVDANNVGADQIGGNIQNNNA